MCPTEILAFSDRIQEFKKLNTEVIACSVDSHFTHLAWISTPRREVLPIEFYVSKSDIIIDNFRVVLVK